MTSVIFRKYENLSIDWHRESESFGFQWNKTCIVPSSLSETLQNSSTPHPNPRLPHTAYQNAIWHLKQTSCLTEKGKAISPLPHTLSAESKAVFGWISWKHGCICIKEMIVSWHLFCMFRVFAFLIVNGVFLYGTWIKGFMRSICQNGLLLYLLNRLCSLIQLIIILYFSIV